MDASQYKDDVLFMWFIKYVSDKYGDSDDMAPPVTIPKGATTATLAELVEEHGGEDGFLGALQKINKAEVNARLKELRPGNAKPQLGEKTDKTCRTGGGAWR